MKTIDKIIESQEAPKDKNVLWVNGDKLLAMVKGKWTPIGGGSSDNVQGGGSEEGSGGLSLEYIRASDVLDTGSTLQFVLPSFSCVIRFEEEESGDIRYIGPSGALIGGFDLDGCKARMYGVSIDAPVFMDGRMATLREVLALYNLTEIYNSIPRITKEEFYTI